MTPAKRTKVAIEVARRWLLGSLEYPRSMTRAAVEHLVFLAEKK